MLAKVSRSKAVLARNMPPRALFYDTYANAGELSAYLARDGLLRWNMRKQSRKWARLGLSLMSGMKALMDLLSPIVFFFGTTYDWE